MSSVSQQDLDVRLQLTGCEFGSLVNTYANNLKWGKKCTNLDELLLLNAFIELIECYVVDVITPATLPTAITYGTYSGLNIIFTLGNGMSIGATIVDQAALSAFVVEFNSTITDYTIDESDIGGGEYSITFTGPCTGASVVSSNKAVGPITFSTGICETTTVYDNCITETQLQKMFDTISKLTKICFQPNGFSFFLTPTPNTRVDVYGRDRAIVTGETRYYI